MKPELYVVFLRPQHDGVLRALADLGVRHFASFYRTYPADVMAHLHAQGAELTSLESICSDEEKNEFVRDGAERAARAVAYLREHPIAVDDAQAFPVGSETIAELVGKDLGIRTAESIMLVRAFEKLAQRYTLAAVVVSEQYSRYARVVLQAACAAGVRTFHITHGTNQGRIYGLFKQVFCDYTLVAGQRGVRAALEAGNPLARIAVVGAPQWDPFVGLVKEREALRRDVRSKCGIAPDARIVLMATTTLESSTTLTVDGMELTLRAFAKGAKRAQMSGAKFTILVKDRIYSGKAGRALVDAVSAEHKLEAIYVEGRPESLVVASDIVVASDSNISIEAMLCGVPTINLWAPNIWINGPYFAAGDGVTQVRYDEPDLLAKHIVSLLGDSQQRAQALRAQQSALSEIVHLPDGRASHRAAHFIASNVAGRGVASATAANGVVSGLWSQADSEELAWNALAARIDRAPSAICAFDMASAGVPFWRGRYPQAHCAAASLEERGDLQQTLVFDGAFDLALLGDGLARLWDPWDFLVKLRANLQPGGRVIATLPNIRNIVLMHWIADGDLPYAPGGAEFSYLRFFTRADALRMFEETGYVVDDLTFIRDPRCAGFRFPPEGPCNVETEKFVVKGTTPQNRAELTSRQLVLVARPRE